MLYVLFFSSLTLSLPELVMETGKVLLTFESLDEIVCGCDHSNETSPAVLSHGTIKYFSK